MEYRYSSDYKQIENEYDAEIDKDCMCGDSVVGVAIGIFAKYY